MVVDASFALRLLLPGPDRQEVHARWELWHRSGAPLLAPSYWPIEIASGLRRLQARGELAAAEARVAMERTFELGVELLPLDLPLAQSALLWAERLDQAKAYDAWYMALAEIADAELWTADLRLVRRARQIGVPWVHAVEE